MLVLWLFVSAIATAAVMAGFCVWLVVCPYDK